MLYEFLDFCTGAFIGARTFRMSFPGQSAKMSPVDIGIMLFLFARLARRAASGEGAAVKCIVALCAGCAASGGVLMLYAALQTPANAIETPRPGFR